MLVTGAKACRKAWPNESARMAPRSRGADRRSRRRSYGGCHAAPRRHQRANNVEEGTGIEIVRSRSRSRSSGSATLIFDQFNRQVKREREGRGARGCGAARGVHVDDGCSRALLAEPGGTNVDPHPSTGVERSKQAAEREATRATRKGYRSSSQSDSAVYGQPVLETLNA